MRPIDADALKEKINTTFWSEIGAIIDNAPTIDAVKVVRCKDCEASRVYGKTTQWLACDSVKEGQATDPDGYCYWGKRREESEVEK